MMGALKFARGEVGYVLGTGHTWTHISDREFSFEQTLLYDLFKVSSPRTFFWLSYILES